MPLISRPKQKGFSLVELMIAATIGLLITLAISTLFITTRQSYSQNDNTAKMQEHARFALELISQDLRHAGFLGNVGCNVSIAEATVTAPAQDCGPTGTATAGLYNFSEAQLALNYGYQINNASAYYSSCITGGTPKSPGNILLIKRTAADPTPPTLTNPTAPDERVANTIYLYANGYGANLLSFPNAPAIGNGEYWEYQPRLYYIDQNDVLYREILDYSGATPTLRAEPLAEGIEAFHVEFGIDQNPDQDKQVSVPDYYYVPPADADPFALGNTAMNNAVSATLYILARTTEPDPDTGYTDNRIYTLGSMPPFGPYNDRFHRRVYSITVALNNLRSQTLRCS